MLLSVDECSGTRDQMTSDHKGLIDERCGSFSARRQMPASNSTPTSSFSIDSILSSSPPAQCRIYCATDQQSHNQHHHQHQNPTRFSAECIGGVKGAESTDADLQSLHPVVHPLSPAFYGQLLTSSCTPCRPRNQSLRP